MKNYCLFKWITNARSLGCDIFIVDNTENNANKEMYDVLGIDWAWCDPKGKTKYQAVTDSQNMIAQHFLKEGYDILWFIETDLFPTINIKHRLLSHNKPVVGAPYFIHTGDDTKLMIQYIDFDGKGNGHFREMGITEAFLQIDGNLKKVHGMGFGCVMIACDIIENIEFRCVPDGQVKGEAFADSFFYSDCAMADLDVFIDTTEIITHWNQDWVKVVEKPDVLN